MVQQGGTIANKNSNQLENLVDMILKDAGYQFVIKNKFILATNGLQQKLYTKQFNICESIYSTSDSKHIINADFVIYNPLMQDKYCIVECKSQSSPGSVDEKYPYLNENIKNKYPYKTIIVLDAPAAKTGAKIWLKNQKFNNNNLLAVFEEFSEFRYWAIKNLQP